MFYLQHESSTIKTEGTIRSTKPGNADIVKSLVSLYDVVTRIRDSCVLGSFGLSKLLIICRSIRSTSLVTHNSKLPLLLTIIRQLMFYWCR